MILAASPEISSSGSVPNFNNQPNFVFHELIAQTSAEIAEIKEKKLRPDQLDLLHRIYEAMLCHKIQESRKLLLTSTFSLMLMGIDPEKIEDAFEKCREHHHFLHYAELFKLYKDTPNKIWIADMYEDSHGLTSDVVHAYQEAFKKRCKKAMRNK